MALQNKVGVPSRGFAGQEVVVGQAVYATYNPCSDGTVQAGAFAFNKAQTQEGVDLGLASATGASATATPIGFVERVVDASITNVLEDATTVYPEGFAVTVAIRGQYYANATGAATAGQKVLVTPTTGAITYGATAGSGTVDTGWVVVIPNGGASAVEGDVIIYQRF